MAEVFHESELAQYRAQGYVIIENAMEHVGLDRAIAAYEEIQAATEPAWRAMVSSGEIKGGYGHGPNAHTMNNVFRYHDLWLDLAMNSRIVPLLKRIVGLDVQVMEMVCHCHHAGTGAHTAWHRDWPAWTHPDHSLKAKAFYFLDDQTADMGCFSLVPGTHKLEEGPPREQYRDERLEEMPGLTKIVAPAGSVIVWDVLCWHTGLANASARDRRIVIYGYMPFWVKKWGHEAPPANIVAWADTPHKRQFMGIHAVEGRASWDRQDVPYLPEHLELAQRKKF